MNTLKISKKSQLHNKKLMVEMQNFVDMINEKLIMYVTAYKRYNIFLVLLVINGIKIMRTMQWLKKEIIIRNFVIKYMKK